VSISLHSLQLAHEVVSSAAGDGLIDWGNTKVDELKGLFRGFAIVAGVGFVIFQAIVSRGAMARVIISGLAAAVFIWIVYNVTDLRDRVDEEVNGQPHHLPTGFDQHGPAGDQPTGAGASGQPMGGPG
jgi:hypothetical protein